MFSGIGEMVCWVITCIVFSENLSLVPSTCVRQPRTTPTHIHVNKNKILKWRNNSLCIYVCSCECSMHAIRCLCAYVLIWPWVPEARGQCWMSSSIAFCVCLFFFGTVFLTEPGAHQLARLAGRWVSLDLPISASSFLRLKTKLPCLDFGDPGDLQVRSSYL